MCLSVYLSSALHTYLSLSLYLSLSRSCCLVASGQNGCIVLSSTKQLLCAFLIRAKKWNGTKTIRSTRERERDTWIETERERERFVNCRILDLPAVVVSHVCRKLATVLGSCSCSRSSTRAAICLMIDCTGSKIMPAKLARIWLAPNAWGAYLTLFLFLFIRLCLYCWPEAYAGTGLSGESCDWLESTER